MESKHSTLSLWWRNTLIIILILGFTILIGLAVSTYKKAAPIPLTVKNEKGDLLFGRENILNGQHVFLKYGLMENGSIWGHGAYLGPDFSAEYLHQLVTDAQEVIAFKMFNKSMNDLNEVEKKTVSEEVKRLLKQNRYESTTESLSFTEFESVSYKKQIKKWADYFSKSNNSIGLPEQYLTQKNELSDLTAFFAWTAWASVVNQPGKSFSYTNNFPYDPEAGNTPTGLAILWSALSLIALLGGLAIVLFVFGRFDFLGWKSQSDHVHPQMLPGDVTASQKATIKYFGIVVLLFLIQTLVGGATAHYRVEPGGFLGFDLSRIFPSNILRTWHLQLAIFWIATAYVAGGLFLAPAVGKAEPKHQVKGVNILFGALLIVVLGSLFGEFLGINQLLKDIWFWFGHQGWEYLDLGRAWQILLAIGLVVWLFLLFRGIQPARKDPESREISSLFLYAALAIPLFYLPALFFDSSSHFSVVDIWRFWIIHLWVEGFFELFVTAMVAMIFYKLGIVSSVTASRVVYLDAILYLGGGIIGTGHHWYWTGQSHITMALGATFSAMEVVPLTLLTLDAWDFIKIPQSKCDICGQKISIPHKWTFYFLIAVGFWNFVGAGIFGFLINLPIISYFEVGTLLTTNHGHAAMMGVFGMLAIALTIFSIRQVLKDEQWKPIEKYVKTSFWGLNIGLVLMVVLNLFPGGILQLMDVLENGYWHARSWEFLSSGFMHTLEWIRFPADAIFILFGVIPLVLMAAKVIFIMKVNK